MAHSNLESIAVKDRIVYDGRKPLTIKELYVDGCKRAALEQRKDGSVKFRFDPVGTFDVQEAEVWLLGLLELMMHVGELTNEKKKKD